MQQVMDHRPAADQPVLQRELAAVHRRVRPQSGPPPYAAAMA